MAELTVPQVDFSSLGQLPAIYKQGQADAVRQQTLASLGQGGQADAAALLRSGDLSLAQLGMTMQQREAEAARQAAQDARQASRDKVTDSHWAASHALARRSADRADEGPVEQAGYRAQVAQKYGIDPNTPEGRAFVVSGKLPESLAGGGEIATASQRAQNASAYGIERGTPEFKAYVLTGKLPDSVANGGNPEVGLNPAYGTTADGRVGAVQFSKTGKAVQTQLPDGFSLSKEPIRVDAGTHVNLVDPITRQVVGTLPKNVAAAEAEKEKGSAQGIAEVALPQVLANSEQILKVIDQVDKHPGKQYGLGMWSKAPTIPGTPQADFRAAAAQLKGQTFLQAYQSLKGGGAITDTEGAKGENALARMDQAQSPESYDAALKDFRQVIQGGMDRARAKARGTATPAAPAADTSGAVYDAARAAIDKGAPRDAVIKRLRDNGHDPAKLERRSDIDNGQVMSDADPEPIRAGQQYAQGSPIQMRPNGNGTVSVINIRTGQVLYTGTPSGAANAQASAAGRMR